MQMDKNTENLTIQILSAIDQPLILVSESHQVLFINKAVKTKFNLSTIGQEQILLGEIMQCNNALNTGDCSNTKLCTFCKFNQVIDKVLKDSSPILNQIGTITTNEQTKNTYWRIHFSAHPIQDDQKYVLLKVHALTKEDEFDKNISDKGIMNDEHIFSKISENMPTAEDTIHTLFKHSQDGFILLNSNCKISKWNQQTLDILEIDNKSQSKVNIEDLIIVNSPSGESFSLKNNSIAKEECYSHYFGKGNLKTAKNREIWVSIDISPIYNSQNKFNGALMKLRDLSTQQKDKEQLKLNQFALEYSPSEFYYINTEGKILYSNKLAKDNSGPSSENTTIFDINTSIDLNRWQDMLQIVKDQEFIQFEAIHKKNDGSTHPVVSQLFMPDLRLKELYCYYCTDITYQKATKASLLKESRYNKSLAEISKELTVHNKLYSVELLVRQYAMEFTESSFAFLAYRDPLTKKLKTSVYTDPPKDYNNQIMIIESHMAKYYNNENSGDQNNNKDKYSGIILNNSNEFTINGEPLNSLIPYDKIASSGIFFHGKYEGFLLVAGKKDNYEEDDKDHLGNLANLFALAINRIQEKSKLVETIEQLELAMEIADIYTYDINPIKNEISTSSQWTKTINNKIAKNKLTLDDFKSKIHPEDVEYILQSVQEHRNSNSPNFKISGRVKINGDQYRWYESKGRIMQISQDGEIERIIGLAVDITEQKELNQALKKSHKEAVTASKTKSAFLARMSHEFRTPLNAIVGFTDVLNTRITDPVQKKYLKSIKKSGQNLLELITDILDYSKFESGKVILKLHPVNLTNMIEETRQMFIPNLKNKNLKFTVNIDQKLPEYIMLDELQLRQVLINLLSNAIKFTEKGSVNLTVICEKTDAKNIKLCFSVKDTGIGIKPESQETIFEDFSHQEDQDKRRYGGTGLGLGIVKSVVELMGGEINLDSSPGKGSTFTVTLKKCQIANTQEIEKINNKDKSKLYSHIKTEEKQPNNINTFCMEDCKEQLKDLWVSFKNRPSFSAIAPIVEIIDRLAHKHNDEQLMDFVQRIQNTSQTFDVEELQNIIFEFEQYSKISS